MDKHRKILRLQGYDYTNDGVYFVTVLTHNRIHYFGQITHKIMHLSPAGQMIVTYWEKLPQKYPHFMLDDFVVMPDHFHALIAINHTFGNDKSIGLSQGIQWFKTVTTNAYIQRVKEAGWIPFDGKLWHRSYYDHIIRDENRLNTLKQYIALNPERWTENEAYPHDIEK
ncbi:MAG: transposase [Anaerolineae bacterium]|nr:transposase [Anaerolineae bacterium]